jgi:hypothetical protein
MYESQAIATVCNQGFCAVARNFSICWIVDRAETHISQPKAELCAKSEIPKDLPNEENAPLDTKVALSK